MSDTAVIPLFAAPNFWKQPDQTIARHFWRHYRTVFDKYFLAVGYADANTLDFAAMKQLSWPENHVTNPQLAREWLVLRLCADLKWTEAGADLKWTEAGAMIRQVWGPRGAAVIETAAFDEAVTRRRWQKSLSERGRPARADSKIDRLRALINEIVAGSKAKVTISALWNELRRRVGGGIVVSVGMDAVVWIDAHRQEHTASRGEVKQRLKRAKKSGSLSG